MNRSRNSKLQRKRPNARPRAALWLQRCGILLRFSLVLFFGILFFSYFPTSVCPFVTLFFVPLNFRSEFPRFATFFVNPGLTRHFCIPSRLENTVYSIFRFFWAGSLDRYTYIAISIYLSLIHISLATPSSSWRYNISIFLSRVHINQQGNSTEKRLKALEKKVEESQFIESAILTAQPGMSYIENIYIDIYIHYR